MSIQVVLYGISYMLGVFSAIAGYRVRHRKGPHRHA